MEIKTPTKKSQIIELFDEGLNVETIAEVLSTSPSYAANVLIEAGRSPDYTDLYVTTRKHDRYSQVFHGVLHFKDLASAKDSVRQIDRLYHQFLREGDRRGMHHAQLLALVGKNRAEGIGKLREAMMFAEWLKEHLEDVPSPTIAEGPGE